MEEKAWAAQHPITMVDGFKQCAVPLRLFGDGVAILGCAKSWRRSIETISIPSYLNNDTSKFSHVPVAMVWKAKRYKEQTMENAWKVLSWSLQSCYDGVCTQTRTLMGKLGLLTASRRL